MVTTTLNLVSVSAHEPWVGTGLFIQTLNDSDGLVDSEKEISIHYTPHT